MSCSLSVGDQVPKLGDVSDIQQQLSKISGLTPERVCGAFIIRTLPLPLTKTFSSS
jgi:hypothetical protein